MHFSELTQHGNHTYPTPIFLDPKKLGTCLVLSDVHAPYTHLESFKAAIDDAKAQGVTSVIINGDFLDMHRVSRYGTNHKAPNVQAEIDFATTLLDYIDEELNSPTIVWKDGNHDIRLQAYINANAPEIAGIAGTTIYDLMKMEEQGIIYTGRRMTTYGDLMVIHGDEIRGIGGIDPARKAAAKFPGMNVMCGHTHRGESRFFKRPDGQINHTHVVGHLGECSPDYHQYTNWRLGWAIIEEVGGTVLVDNMVHENGRLMNVSSVQR